MINIYFKEGTELGYDFYLFTSEEYGRVFQKYDYESQMEEDLLVAKRDILRANMEDFVLRFDNHDIIRNELQNSIINRLVDFLNWMWKEDDIKKLCEVVKRLQPMIVTIVNSYKGADRQRAIKEWKLLMQFVENELKN